MKNCHFNLEKYQFNSNNLENKNYCLTLQSNNKIIMKKFRFLALAILAVSIYACKSTDTNTYTANADCSKVPAVNTYNTTIKPLMAASCAYSGCHDTKTAANGVILDTYAGAKKTFSTGKGLCTINHDGCAKNMPEGSDKLSADLLNLLACWVKNSTPE